MDRLNQSALATVNAIKQAPGFAELSPTERESLDYHLARIANVLSSKERAPASRQNLSQDPYAVHLSAPYSMPLATPYDMPGGRFGPTPGQQSSQVQTPQPQSNVPQQAARPAGTEVLGERARRALDAVDFPSFVAELIQGTFQAIVDATAQQVREYAKLVADISRSVDDFTRDNVSLNQARDRLVEKHPAELMLVLPRPGENIQPRVVPRENADSSPPWLADYGLENQDLSEELVEGGLLEASRRMLGEERIRTLATMVLMGVNRLNVSDGQLTARLQFHAKAREKVNAEIVGQQGVQQQGIAARSASAGSAVSTMISTVDVNAQADVSIKTDLVGEVSLRFRTETFDLNNFADSPTMAMINRHSLAREKNLTPQASFETAPTNETPVKTEAST